MANPNSADVQLATLRSIWEHYRAQAKTSRRLKAAQGQWRSIVLVGAIVAMLLTPFSKTFDNMGMVAVGNILTVTATVLFSLLAWLHKEVLGDDSEQLWVRTRQTGEGLKTLAFRFLGGVPPFDVQGAEVALRQAEALVDKAGVAADPLSPAEAIEHLPKAPLSVDDYLRVRVDDQLSFYAKALERERTALSRIVTIGNAISIALVILGALGALVAKDWRDIWAPALSAAATMATAQSARARHRFLIDSYSTAQAKLKFARTRWDISPKTGPDAERLVDTVETALAAENAGWVQQMLFKPVVPDQSAAPVAARV